MTAGGGGARQGTDLQASERAQVQGAEAACGHPAEGSKLARRQQKTGHGQAGHGPARTPQFGLTQAGAEQSLGPA